MLRKKSISAQLLGPHRSLPLILTAHTQHVVCVCVGQPRNTPVGMGVGVAASPLSAPLVPPKCLCGSPRRTTFPRGSTEQTRCLCCAADLLADKGEELGEAATSTANELKKPQNAALGVLALLGLGTTVAYPHESFQFFGFVGLQLTAIVTFLSYDKPEDAMAALNKSSRSFADKVGSAASSASSKMSSPAAAAGAAVAGAASKAAKKEESAPKAASPKDSKPEAKPAITTMFVKASADKPAPAKPASNTPSPSTEKKAPFVPSATKTPQPVKKDEKTAKKGEDKKKWPDSIAAAATEAAAIAQDVPKPVVEIVDKSGDGSKNGNAKGKGGVKSEKS